PQLTAELVGRQIECHEVVTDVHVAGGVDPFRADGVAMPIEWRRQVKRREGIGKAHERRNPRRRRLRDRNLPNLYQFGEPCTQRAQRGARRWVEIASKWVKLRNSRAWPS